MAPAETDKIGSGWEVNAWEDQPIHDSDPQDTHAFAESTVAATPQSTNSVDSETNQKRIAELESQNSELLDQLHQYEFNFVEIQNENDTYLNEINELKLKLSDMRLKNNNTLSPSQSFAKQRERDDEKNDEELFVEKQVTVVQTTISQSDNEFYIEQLRQYETNIESIQNENDTLTALVDELNKKIESLRAQMEESAAKLALTDRQNLKLKAKLKQLLTGKEGKQQIQDQSDSVGGKQSSVIDVQTILTRADLEKLEASNLHFKGLIKELESLLSGKSEATPLLSTPTSSPPSATSSPRVSRVVSNITDAINVSSNNVAVASLTISSEDLVSFGAKIASAEIEGRLVPDLVELNDELSWFLLNNEVRFDALSKTFAQLQRDHAALNSENNTNKAKLNDLDNLMKKLEADLNCKYEYASVVSSAMPSFEHEQQQQVKTTGLCSLNLAYTCLYIQ